MLNCSKNCDGNSNVTVTQNIYISQRESSTEKNHDITEVGEGECKNNRKILKTENFQFAVRLQWWPRRNTLDILKEAMSPSKIMSYFYTSQGIL
jgi:hypothetical protein